MDGLLRDLAFSMRALLRAPLLLVTAVLTLALGIGVSTGVFAVAYGVLVRPLPFADPDRLVVITLHRSDRPAADVGVPLQAVDEWRQRARAFSGLAAHSTAPFTIRGGGDPRSVRAAMVTDGFFDVLGLPAAEGSAARIAGTEAALALSANLAAQLPRDGAWRRSGLSIGSAHFDVAAVLPRTFSYPGEPVDLWIPARAVPNISLFSMDDSRDFHLVARLAAGVTMVQAQKDAARVAGELNDGLTEPRKRFATVVPLGAHLRRDARTTVVPFVAGAVIVLLIACANVSGLLVGRAAARRGEFAVRRALGGSTAHLLRASFVESVGIALAGWALGLWFAHLVVRAFATFGANAIGNLASVSVDPAVVVGSLLLALVVGLMCGAAPAFRALRRDSAAVLKQAPARSGGARARAQGLLVVAQIALTVVLLVCAGLLMRTVKTIVAAERGFDLQRVLATRLMLSETVRYDVTERAAFIERLVQDVRQLPGVAGAGVGSDLPPNGTQFRMTIRVEMESTSEVFALSFAAVTPGYLEAIGAQLVKGRMLDAGDSLADVPRVVVSEAAARRLFFDRDPIGREWPATIPSKKGRVRPIIVGVVRDVKFGGLDRDAPASIFVPWAQLAPSQAWLVVRTTVDPAGLAPAVRRLVQQLDPTLPIIPPQTLEDVVAGSIAERRLRLQLAAAFAALALVLASVALWGAVAQGVVERRRELAIRMALGSTAAGAVGLIVRGGVVLILAGVTSGVVAAAVSAQGLRHLLHGVGPLDPFTFAAGAATAALLSFAACYAPARRAAAISPAELLREG